MGIIEQSINELRDTLIRYRELDSSRARALPGCFYTQRNFLNYEIENLLRREWLCVGRVDEIPNPGDYFTTDLLDEPLLVVRGDDSQIRVLSNVCRHRGMLVAEGAGRKRTFVCPYHGWTYKLDGRLAGAPRMSSQVDFDPECRLPAFNSEIWQGFICVNFDQTAAPLAPHLTGLDTVLKHYHTDVMHSIFVREEVWDTNWKCLLENFMEGYHLSIVHPQMLGDSTPTALCEKIDGGEGYTGYRANYPESAPPRDAHHPDLTAAESRCSVLFSVFPCLVASQSPDILVYLSLQPEGVDKVRVRWGGATHRSDLTQPEIDAYTDKWNAINAEDKEKLSRVQRGFGSRFSTPGPLAPEDYEGTIWDFYQYLASRLTERTAV